MIGTIGLAMMLLAICCLIAAVGDTLKKILHELVKANNINLADKAAALEVRMTTEAEEDEPNTN